MIPTVDSTPLLEKVTNQGIFTKSHVVNNTNFIEKITTFTGSFTDQRLGFFYVIVSCTSEFVIFIRIQREFCLFSPS